MNKLYFGENFLDNLYEFFVDVSINLNDYVIKILVILLILIILKILWFFLTKLKITIRYEKKTQFSS